METSAVIFLAVLAATLAADHFVIWRRFETLSRIRPEHARRRLWQSWMGMLWLLGLTVVVVWVHDGRPWSLLRLQLPAGWRLLASVALVLTVVALYLPTISRLRRVSSERKAALRSRMVKHANMLPHTRADLAWFIALSVTAGICEELVFRGYLLWAAQSVLGLWPAAALCCVVFALAHAYQGASGILTTGLIGVLFMAVVLSLDSLVPAMVAHALVDIGQGIVMWLILRPGGAPEGRSHSDESVAPSVGAEA